MATIRKAVITAAGKGTRQYPASKTVQKELFPLVDVDGFTKPTLQIIVEEVLSSGIDEVCIIVNPENHEAVRSHFKSPSAAQLSKFSGKEWALDQAERLSDMEQRLTFVVQQTQDGYGHAVYQSRDFVGNDPFLMLLGDHIYMAPDVRCAQQVIEKFDAFGDPIASVTLVPEEVITRYGLVATEPIDGSEKVRRILRMAEKPTVEQARAELRSVNAPTGIYYTFFGIHALPPAIFDCLKYLIDNNQRIKGEIQFTSAQEILLRESSRYIALCIDGKRYDMGVPEGLIETQTALALNSPYAHKLYETVAAIERQKLTAARR